MSNPFEFLGKAFETARGGLSYKVERVSLDLTEELVARLQQIGMSRVELARKIGVSPPYITKFLNGAGNYTLETLVKISDAVGCDLKTHLATRDCESMWVDVPLEGQGAFVASIPKVKSPSVSSPSAKWSEKTVTGYCNTEAPEEANQEFDASEIAAAA